jgi:hypothetical protein
MSQPATDQQEELRQLRAARDGRLLVNESGRYVIDGEARPVPKVRKRLLYDREWIIWTWKPKGMVLTDEGRAALDLMESASTDSGQQA